jgi:hypothetical protein
MKTGAIRLLEWESTAASPRTVARPSAALGFAYTIADSDDLAIAEPATEVAGAATPSVRVALASAADEAKLLLRIAAEVEGALVVQYLYSAYSVLPGVIVNSNAGSPIQSDDWYDTVRDISKQEMGHLITVQNLLLSLNAPPHLDRENFPIDSDLYPFPFELEILDRTTLAKSVAAEAPAKVRPEDQADYDSALKAANASIGGVVSRVGQIYERLYFLFQDGDAPQEPWSGVKNPFPDWPNWHVDRALIGFNQNCQAQPNDWRGSDASGSPDSAVYILRVSDGASAREAIYRISLQGEGLIDGPPGETHFDKFLRLFREYRRYTAVPGASPMTRSQAQNPTTRPGQAGSITNPATLAWANLANCRYEMLLLDIALALSLGSSGSAPGTTATAQDFRSWAFREMTLVIKNLGQQLRTMPMTESAAEPLAGLPFELPVDRDLPVELPAQVARLRSLITNSQVIRASIRADFNPTQAQRTFLTALDSADSGMLAKLASPGNH